MLNYLLVDHLVSVLLVFSMEKVIDLGKAFDMIHETDGKVIDLGKAFDMIPETYHHIRKTYSKIYFIGNEKNLYILQKIQNNTFSELTRNELKHI